jgi:hypothetical protein
VAFALPGICAEARLQASFGQVPAHLARKGDPVLVEGNRYRQIKAVREYRFEPELLNTQPQILPIALRSQCADPYRPDGTFRVSPGQYVMRSGHAPGEARGLASARELGPVAGEPGGATEPLSYYRFVFDEPAMLWVEGLWLKCPCPEEDG